MGKVLILFDSASGNTGKMAALVAEGASSVPGTEVRLREVRMRAAKDSTASVPKRRASGVGSMNMLLAVMYKWIERKSMPAHKVGRLWKFQAEEIDAWVREGRAGSGKSSARRKQKNCTGR